MTQCLDRYFYSIELDNKDNVLVHFLGNVFYNDSIDSFQFAEYKFVYIDIEAAQKLLKDGELYDFINERVGYLVDISEDDALQICESFFDENGSIKNLHIADVDEYIVCGNYWFDL